VNGKLGWTLVPQGPVPAASLITFDHRERKPIFEKDDIF
jgi:hypothetical protein